MEQGPQKSKQGGHKPKSAPHKNTPKEKKFPTLYDEDTTSTKLTLHERFSVSSPSKTVQIVQELHTPTKSNAQGEDPSSAKKKRRRRKNNKQKEEEYNDESDEEVAVRTPKKEDKPKKQHTPKPQNQQKQKGLAIPKQQQAQKQQFYPGSYPGASGKTGPQFDLDDDQIDAKKKKRRTPRKRRAKKEYEDNQEMKKTDSAKKGTKTKAQVKIQQHQQMNQTPKSAKKQRPRFEKYLNKKDIDKGISEKRLYKGTLRINGHNTREAYVTCEGLARDVYIDGVILRNRAFEGDTVIVELFSEDKWKPIKNKEDDQQQQQPNHDDDEVIAVKELAKELFVDDEKAEKRLSTGIIVKDDDDEEEDDENVIHPGEDEEVRIDDPLHLDDEDDDEEDDSEEEEDDDEESEDDDEDEEDDGGEHYAQSEWVPIKSEVKKITDKISSVSISPKKSDLSKSPIKSITTPSSTTTAATPSKVVEYQPSGKIVAILESKHTREVVGYVKPVSEGGVKQDDRWACLVPIDIKTPKFLIPITQIPDYYKDPKSYDDKLVIGEIINWRDNTYFPLGKYRGILGQAGEIEPETEAILMQYSVDHSDWPDEILDSIPSGLWKIPDDELSRRRDLREERIFTIDPPTAKDLDDALHCKKLEDGSFEVGVHIADVSFFVKSGTLLDKIASERATTVYLIQKAIPMLPHILCENLCSLNPGVDRLAFSVIWKLTPEGKILDEWFGRTVIRSCSKMPYDVAQLVIEGKISKSWDEMDVNKTFQNLGPEGKHTVPEIVNDILNMQMIASSLRRHRFESGALSLNNVKLAFKLDGVGNPITTYQYITREANHLVEEFMLLANQQVAIRIADYFPEASLLRNHVTPLVRKLETFVKFVAKNVGIAVDSTSAKSMALSLETLKSKTSQPVFATLQFLATRSMQLAKYFCTGDLELNDWKHYALNMSRYTHFTSPIRRYPDIIVHRLLEATILLDTMSEEELKKTNYVRLPKRTDLSRICDHCNDKKLNSRKAQESSATLFLCMYLKKHPQVADSVVLSVGDKYLSVIIPVYGIERRAYFEDAQSQNNVTVTDQSHIVIHWVNKKKDEEKQLVDESKVKENEKQDKEDVPEFEPVDQKVTILTVVKVKLVTKLTNGRPDVSVIILHPNDNRHELTHELTQPTAIPQDLNVINASAFIDEESVD